MPRADQDRALAAAVKQLLKRQYVKGLIPFTREHRQL